MIGRRASVAYLVIAGVSVAALAVLFRLDGFEALYQFTRQHESWELDEVFNIFIVATFALIAVLWVHDRRLNAEIKRRHQAVQAAAVSAHYDATTGIANRQLFQAEFSRRLAAAKADGSVFAVLAVDVDQFLTVNERLGHDAGDLVLLTLIDRLRSVLGPRDFLARLGGDEFAILVHLARTGGDGVFRVASRLLSTLEAPFVTPTGSVEISVSIGIAKFPRDAETETVLLQRAETALSQAKANGGNRYALYNRELDELNRDRVKRLEDLALALDRSEIIAYYQPIIRLATQAPAGFEALARWNHPTEGILGAGEFIPLAEDTGLIGRVLTQMLTRVCEDARDWDPALTIAVNIAPAQLCSPDIAQTILRILEAHQFAPNRLEVEITETGLVQDIVTARQSILDLKAAGVRISLDDFGTGFSSLRHLQDLPLDKVKIDRSFIDRLGTDVQCRKIVDAMLDLCGALGLATVAEGVETEFQMEWTRVHRCDFAQGYFFARPMAAAEATALPGVMRSYPAHAGNSEERQP